MSNPAKVPDCEDPDSLDVQDELKWDLKFCAHCFDTMESLETYQSHFMYAMDAKIECPKLRREGCPKCGDSGDKAHDGEHCYNTKRAMIRAKKKVEPLRIQLLRRLTEEKRNTKRKYEYLLPRSAKRARKLF